MIESILIIIVTCSIITYICLIYKCLKNNFIQLTQDDLCEVLIVTE